MNPHKDNYVVLLINLDKSTERLAHCDRLLTSNGILYERIPAVYGKDLSLDELNSIKETGTKGQYYKTLLVGEIGCYMSHRKTWQYIVDRQLDFAVVLEDDINFGSIDFKALINAIKSISRPWFYLKLAGRYRDKHIVSKQALDAFDLVTFSKVPSRTNAQVVSLEGARRLLAASETFSRPIDVDLQYWWEKHLYIDGLLPFPMSGNLGVDSEIQDREESLSLSKNRLRQYWNRGVFVFKRWVEGRRLTKRLSQ